MIDKADLSSFRASFDGAMLTPADGQFDRVRREAIWNGNIDRRPALIVQPATAEQVAKAVDFGRRLGLEVTARGGGHSYPGHGICDDGLMIDLGRMNEVSFDIANQRVNCGGGATWAQLDGATCHTGWR
jgi:FAD/FMN-containing dehydrogenase